MAWAIVAALAFVQLARLAIGFNGASPEEALYLTAGLRTWDGELIGDQLLSQLSGSFLWPAIGALGYQAFGLAGARALALLFLLVAAGAMILGTRQLFGERASLFTAIAMAVSAPFLVTGHLAMMESMALAGMAMCFFAVTRAIARDDRLWLFAGSLAMFTAILAQYRAVVFVVPIALLLYVMRGPKGQLDVVVFVLSASLGFIVYFEAFSRQVEIALQEISLLAPYMGEQAFASASTKVTLLLIWGLLPLAAAVPAMLHGPQWRRRSALALAAPPAVWLAALITLANREAMLVFPDLAIGMLAVYPVAGLGMSRLPGRGVHALSLGIILASTAILGWFHTLTFDQSWVDYRGVTDHLRANMQPGHGVLVNDQWPFALALYGDDLIDAPAELLDADTILTNSEVLDLCTYEWFVDGTGPLAWPAFVQGVISSCGEFDRVMSDPGDVAGFSATLRRTTTTTASGIWFNAVPFEDLE